MNTKGSISGNINLRTGQNTVRNYGGDIIGDITLGNDTDLIVNRGAIYGDIVMGGANNFFGDKLFNRGLIIGSIDIGQFTEDDGLLDNRGGTIDGGIRFGSGSDIVDNRGGTILGFVNLGAGHDTYILGLGAQLVDGGAGVDMLDLSRGGGVIMQLGTTAGQVGLPADSNFIGFENVKGSLTGANTITGDAGNNDLTGGRGVDKLSGGIGTDNLNGGDGNDFLTGGAGKDVLNGGAGADTFLFATGDSTVAAFDTISDFSKAEKDIINLASMDAIASSSSDQAFTFIGAAAFSNVAGQLRFRAGVAPDSTPLTIVEGDTNGDSIADFAIQLRGTFVLAALDFVL